MVLGIERLIVLQAMCKTRIRVADVKVLAFFAESGSGRIDGQFARLRDDRELGEQQQGNKKLRHDHAASVLFNSCARNGSAQCEYLKGVRCGNLP